MKELLKKLRAPFSTRAWRAGGYSVFAALLVIAMAAVANLAVQSLPVSMTELDMTANKMYSISPATEQTLGTLEQDVDIYWLVQEGAENNTMAQVLAKYAEYPRVTVTEVDTVRYPGFAAKYTDETPEENSIIVSSGDRSVYIPYSDIWTYSDFDTYSQYYYYTGEEYRDVFNGEGKLTGAVSYVTAQELPTLYYLTGHGEKGVSEGVLSDLAMENLQTAELNLLTAEAVPADCDILAVFGPTRDLTAHEREMVADYIDAGGQVLWTTAYTTEALPNFDALLAKFDVAVTNGYVMESDSRYYNYGYVDLVLPTIARHTVTSPLLEESYAVMLPDAQAIEFLGKDEALTAEPLLTSSSTAYLKATVEGVDNFDRAEGDLDGPFNLAAVSENADTGARLVIFGATDFVEADYNDMVAGANEDLFLNAANWLCSREEGVSIRPKTLTSDVLTFDESTASVLTIALTVVVPLLFLAGGLTVFIKRRRR